LPTAKRRPSLVGAFILSRTRTFVLSLDRHYTISRAAPARFLEDDEKRRWALTGGV